MGLQMQLQMCACLCDTHYKHKPRVKAAVTLHFEHATIGHMQQQIWTGSRTSKLVQEWKRAVTNPSGCTSSCDANS